MPSRAQCSFRIPSLVDLQPDSRRVTSSRHCAWPGFRSVLLVAVALFTGWQAIAQGPPASAQVPHEPSLVSVVGHGVVHGEPDLASLELGVTVTEADVRDAVGQLDSRIAAVMEAVRSLGVAEQDIRTTSFNVWREERYPQESNDSKPTYRAHHMLNVQLDDAQRAGEVLAAAVEAGANSIGGISFGIADSRELERQAREAAVTDAQRKAQGFAEAAGVALGAPVSIEELSASNGSRPMFDRAAATVMSESQVAPGRLSVEVRVAISYRLEQP